MKTTIFISAVLLLLTLVTLSNGQFITNDERIDSIKVELVPLDFDSSFNDLSSIQNMTSFGFGQRPLEPDPSAVGTNLLFRGCPGNFVLRSCDLFMKDGTDFNDSIAITRDPFVLRALSRYDMDLDPMWDGGQKLTRPGTKTSLEPVKGGYYYPGTFDRQNRSGDPVLYIDLAAFYDDNENDSQGGFWANWKIIVTPLVYKEGDPWYDWARFYTKFRGPFCSGEKLEVGDTDGGFLPQVMHYENFGIWNWNWSNHDAVEVKIMEGDAGWLDDHIACIVVRKDESTSKPLIIGDTGHIVNLFWFLSQCW